MIRIAVCGAAGRMGKRILSLAAANTEKFHIAGAVEFKGHPLAGTPVSSFIEEYSGPATLLASLSNCIKNTDVVIDFCAPQATVHHVEICRDAGKAIVIGTTGIDHTQRGLIIEYAEKIPIVMAPNMSVGVNLLFSLVRDVARRLDADYDIEIVETHHRFKKDAPSGTALRLAEAAAEGRNVSLDEKSVYGRKGLVGERAPGEIGIHAVRSGSVVGEHTVSFANLGERIELTHRAESRDTFALGALRAAEFLATQHSGIFDMQDVLGLK
ncbi:4-hydroxy-tetrahydrodipicolinate reductase [bacterium]|nr:4-hydroxy-tetrahydrodipicolinate reductase [bacterium]